MVPDRGSGHRGNEVLPRASRRHTMPTYFTLLLQLALGFVNDPDDDAPVITNVIGTLDPNG